MIKDRIGRNGEVLLPINHNYNKICDVLAVLEKESLRNSEKFLASNEKKKSHLSARTRWRVLSNYIGMTRTVLLHYPISAEIRTVDSQSDLKILLYL